MQTNNLPPKIHRKTLYLYVNERKKTSLTTALLEKMSRANAHHFHRGRRRDAHLARLEKRVQDLVQTLETQEKGGQNG